MKWRFWQKHERDLGETTLTVTLQNLTEGKIFYVRAPSPEKALELIEKLREEVSS